MPYMAKAKGMWNIPNLLTLLRIVIIPIFVVVFYWPSVWARPASALLFAVAAVTDWLDGYLARRWGQTSALGAFMDPVADKLMVAVALVLLVQSEPTVAFAIPAAVIIGREITISALREWMAILGARARVAVSMVGKFKTSAQMLAIFLLLFGHDPGTMPVHNLGMGLLYLAAVLTIWSMFVYLRAAWPSLVAHHGAAGQEEKKIDANGS
jgi:CDP-diacylglycerol--glycerol-3-phosphate 3-phosphatidyltransferase